MLKKILFVASEGLPYIKTGGLADVVGSLPQAIMKNGYEVSVIMPLYLSVIHKYMGEMQHETTVHLKEAMYDCDVRIFSHETNGVKFFFVEHHGYFEREGLYGYFDDGERFSFFQHAVLQYIIQSGNYPDLIHSHDWHAGMIAALARIYYAENERIRTIRQIFTIHNLAYQGNFSADMLESCLGIPMSYYYDGSLRFHDGISFMKAAIVYSDKISTVSNTYAYEILGETYGQNMQDLLKSREHDLWGIVNGIDVDDYSPSTDEKIAKKFSDKSLYNKYKNKVDLQHKLGLEERKDVCLIGMVSRLTWQKGVNLILEKMRDIMAMDVQLIVLGTGESAYENDLRRCEDAYSGRMVYYGGYSDEIARSIYSGCDLLLMPSMFEPCGISQQIAMRYATLPIVRETGGLKDTVMPYNRYEKTGNGFSFGGFNSWEFFSVLQLAVYTYYNSPKDFKMLRTNAMNTDVSWDKSARLYIEMYEMY